MANYKCHTHDYEADGKGAWHHHLTHTKPPHFATVPGANGPVDVTIGREQKERF